ncbi:general transcription and DNA repair factor IIH subunit TFB1-1-like isoform X2 [Trifolium pratense]|uniref:general transcription and DNA repair factor IIH subunit TFB1-1-like isoform X2 n=1 Tax=Trifolium pratense TaxID=57577 RepID=UPI001E69058A|nr:general transcription and DNA repair factor IIH subunit TFB1-1-like isoform X2 [Trifolium pratense]
MFFLSFQNWVCSQELLRHFWSSYPVTTQSLVNKARRLKDAISQIDTKLESDLRHQVSLVVHPKHQALEAALVHYGADDKKRNAKGPKPNDYV